MMQNINRMRELIQAITSLPWGSRRWAATPAAS